MGDLLADFFSYLENTPLPTSTSAVSGPIKTPESTAKPEPAKSVNKAGVAAGVVVGVLAIAGIGIGLFLLMKKRRRDKVEEEYRKSAAAREFARKPEQDHRLDPVMIQRRDSVGSIADNQDYSRRILKVSAPILKLDCCGMLTKVQSRLPTRMAIRIVVMIRINIFFRFEGWVFRSRKDRIVGFFCSSSL